MKTSPAPRVLRAPEATPNLTLSSGAYGDGYAFGYGYGLPIGTVMGGGTSGRRALRRVGFLRHYAPPPAPVPVLRGVRPTEEHVGFSFLGTNYGSGTGRMFDATVRRQYAVVLRGAVPSWGRADDYSVLGLSNGFGDMFDDGSGGSSREAEILACFAFAAEPAVQRGAVPSFACFTSNGLGGLQCAYGLGFIDGGGWSWNYRRGDTPLSALVRVLREYDPPTLVQHPYVLCGALPDYAGLAEFSGVGEGYGHGISNGDGDGRGHGHFHDGTGRADAVTLLNDGTDATLMRMYPRPRVAEVLRGALAAATFTLAARYRINSTGCDSAYGEGIVGGHGWGHPCGFVNGSGRGAAHELAKAGGFKLLRVYEHAGRRREARPAPPPARQLVGYVICVRGKWLAPDGAWTLAPRVAQVFDTRAEANAMALALTALRNRLTGEKLPPVLARYRTRKTSTTPRKAPAR